MMRHHFRRLMAFTALILAVSAAPLVQAQDAMPAFRSDNELRAFLRSLTSPDTNAPPTPIPPPPTVVAPNVATSETIAEVPGSRVLDSTVVVTAALANPSITNTQEVGVDEGGIVKVAGDYLVILRRGRLFTVSTAGATLRPAASIDAFPPGADAEGDWYDEMLIRGDQIIIVGYSYERGGTEINRFRIGPDGSLTYRDSHHLKSDDYYSSRNFASRLIGDQLIFYTPLYLDVYSPEAGEDLLDVLPGLSRWRPEQEEPVFRRMTRSRQVYAPAPLRTEEGRRAIDAMHTITRCDLAAVELTCDATVVLGQEGRSFYVSQEAVYVWISPWDEGKNGQGFLYRIPLDNGRPQAIGVRGAPVDQFSFKVDERVGRLNVLVTPEGGGDAMWMPEFAGGTPALLQLDLERLGDGHDSARQNDYRLLPSLGPDASLEHNRFIGSHLLYAQQDDRGQLVVVPLGRGEPVRFPLDGGGVSRIEQLGRDGLVVAEQGSSSVFLSIDLSSGAAPSIVDRFNPPNSREAESRSHAFFFRPDPNSRDASDGLMGLPVMRPVSGFADMMFLRREDRALSGFGRLLSQAKNRNDDGCVASCVDWYGNARPIFLGDRVFALLGYELVEGDASGDAIRETRRVSFAPPPSRSED